MAGGASRANFGSQHSVHHNGMAIAPSGKKFVYAYKVVKQIIWKLEYRLLSEQANKNGRELCLAGNSGLSFFL